MSEKPAQIVYRSLHAPTKNGSALIEPPIAEFAKQVAEYFRTPPSGNRLCWGAKSLLLHRIEARIEMFRRLVEEPKINQPIVMVGHQPQLFHPGVWMKNFVASKLAKAVGGTGVNLTIDNDLMKSASIVSPAREHEGATVQIPFDAHTDEMPFEERVIANPQLLNSFVARLTETMPQVDWKPLIEKFWPTFAKVWSSVGHDPNLGRQFSGLHRTIEGYWSYPLYDLPLSAVISTRPFARLALEIVHDAKAFAEIYNACLAEYRNVHGLRSRSHPAPDLEIVSDNEVELPFWLWTTSAPRRKRAFVRRDGSAFVITDREGTEWSANFDEGEALLEKAEGGILLPTDEPHRPKLRPKALITTLYARLLLCDGFVHGIGGSKYDQVTEAIAARWGLGTLAPMQCATMTLRLPLPMEVVSEEEVRKRRRQLRDFAYHPEKFISEANLPPNDQARADELIASKDKWVAESSPELLYERHQQIGAINSELAAMIGGLRQRYETAYANVQAKFAAQQPWLSREFPAILFPEEMLKSEFERVTRL